VRRLVRLAPHGLRREVGSVGLDEDSITRHGGGRYAERPGVRKRRVPGERHEVAAVDGHANQIGRREAVQHDYPAEALESACGLPVRLAVVDDNGKPELVGKLEVCFQEPLLLLGCCETANGVESRLTHCDRLRVREELSELVDPVCLGSSSLMRVDTERGVDTFVRVRDRESSSARVDSGADRDDPRDTRFSGPRNDRRRVHVAGVEVRVRIRHAVTAGASIRGKSGCAGAIPDRAGVRP
jgi:hypothetical protein